MASHVEHHPDLIARLGRAFTWPGRYGEAAGLYAVCCIGVWLFAGAPLVVALWFSTLAGNTIEDFDGRWLVPGNLVTGAVLHLVFSATSPTRPGCRGRVR